MKETRFLILKVFYTKGKLCYFYAKETAIMSTLRMFVNKGRVIEIIGFADLQFISSFVSNLYDFETLPAKNVKRKVIFSKDMQVYDKVDDSLQSILGTF